MFDPHFSFSNHISDLSRSYFIHNNLCRIRYFPFKAQLLQFTLMRHSIKTTQAFAIYLKLISQSRHQSAQAPLLHRCILTPLSKYFIKNPFQGPVTNLQHLAILPAKYLREFCINHPANPLYPILINLSYLSLSQPPLIYSSHVLQQSHFHHCFTSLERSYL